MSASVVGRPATTSARLRIRGLSKTFPGTVALSGVDLDLEPGQVHALIGANGSGKSTLVKILAGYQHADPGSQIVVGEQPLEPASPQGSFRSGCRFVHQDLALIDSMSVADNVLMTGGWPSRAGTIRSRSAESEVRDALNAIGADVPAGATVGELSPVMRTLVAVARALRPDPHSELGALVLDEPTARLPAHEVAVLGRTLRDIAAQGAAVLIVSHHLDEVLELADVVTVLRDGIRVFTKPAGMLTRHDLITAMTGDELIEQDMPTSAGECLPTGEVVLECAGLAGESFVDVSFQVRHGEVVGIAGLEGSGRDELLPALFGASARFAGTVQVTGTALPPANLKKSMAAGVAYLPADRARSAAVPELPARENLTLADLRRISRPGLLHRARERLEAKQWFAKLGVRPKTAIDQPLSTFSGGNQQKILLARWLRRAPRVLLLDEPTYGVDAAAQASLHAYLLDAAAHGAGIVISSSDEHELATMCHRVLVLHRGRIGTELSRANITARAIAAAVIHTDDVEPTSGGRR